MSGLAPSPKPIIKKLGLNPDNPSNFHPISNLPFLSKILQHALAYQLRTHLTPYNLFESFQSGFQWKHSTKTALLKITNNHCSTVMLMTFNSTYLLKPSPTPRILHSVTVLVKLNQSPPEQWQIRHYHWSHIPHLNHPKLQPQIHLGIIFNSQLMLAHHITRTTFPHLKNTAHLCPALNLSAAETPTHAFITTRLDYCNHILYSSSSKVLNKLQNIQPAQPHPSHLSSHLCTMQNSSSGNSNTTLVVVQPWTGISTGHKQLLATSSWVKVQLHSEWRYQKNQRWYMRYTGRWMWRVETNTLSSYSF